MACSITGVSQSSSSDIIYIKYTMVVFSKILQWAFDHSDNKNPKYYLKHPFFASVFSLSIFALVLKLISKKQTDEQFKISDNPKLRYFLCLYLVCMIATRMYQNGAIALYQILWACNMSILQVIYGLYIGDSRLIQAALITISVDQILWYFDIAGLIILKKYPIGVAKYLSWPQTTNLRRMTSTHHLWFIPLLLFILKNKKLSMQSYKISVIIVSVLSVLGRIATPKTVYNSKGVEVYMNINMAWQFWKDVHISLFQKYSKLPFVLSHPILVGCWSCGNLVFLYILRRIQKLILFN